MSLVSFTLALVRPLAAGAGRHWAPGSPRVGRRSACEREGLARISRTMTCASTSGVPRLRADFGSISMRAVSPRRARLPGRIVSSCSASAPGQMVLSWMAGPLVWRVARNARPCAGAERHSGIRPVA